MEHKLPQLPYELDAYVQQRCPNLEPHFLLAGLYP